MIIIQLAGGLGNQMFQYALYLQLKNLGKEVKIDDVAGFVQDEKRTPVLAAFGIDYERPSKKELIQMLDSSLLPWNRVRRKLFGRKKKAYFEEDKHYHPEIMTWDDIYLEGYWQTEKYFAGIADEIRQVYDTDRLLRHIRENNTACGTDYSTADSGEMPAGHVSLKEWIDRIEVSESVSVHIRRGDYLLPENQELFGGICTEEYYMEAMRQMRQEHPDCQFYLFTNDKKWTLKQLREYQEAYVGDIDSSLYAHMEVVDVEEQSDYAEFVLMSKCKHNILANSSFSWWASYLNKNPRKKVFAPDKWLNGWDCEDFYREDMRRVKGIRGT